MSFEAHNVVPLFAGRFEVSVDGCACTTLIGKVEELINPETGETFQNYILDIKLDAEHMARVKLRKDMRTDSDHNNEDGGWTYEQDIPVQVVDKSGNVEVEFETTGIHKYGRYLELPVLGKTLKIEKLVDIKTTTPSDKTKKPLRRKYRRAADYGNDLPRYAEINRSTVSAAVRFSPEMVRKMDEAAERAGLKRVQWISRTVEKFLDSNKVKLAPHGDEGDFSKHIKLRFDEAVLKRIDAAGEISKLGRSEWLRRLCVHGAADEEQRPYVAGSDNEPA